MPSCSVCAIDVPRAYETAGERARALRGEAEAVLVAAEREAAALLDRADRIEEDAATEAARDWLRFCPGHFELLPLETRHLVEAGRLDRTVRKKAERQALAHVAAGTRYG